MSDNHDDRDRLFHMDSRRIQSQNYDQSPPYRWTILQALEDGITSSHFGILITVLVVALVHFRGRLSFLARLCFQSYLCFFLLLEFVSSQTLAWSVNNCSIHSRMAPVLSRPRSRKDRLGNSPTNRSLVPISRSGTRCSQDGSKRETESTSTTNEHTGIGNDSDERKSIILLSTRVGTSVSRRGRISRRVVSVSSNIGSCEKDGGGTFQDFWWERRSCVGA